MIQPIPPYNERKPIPIPKRNRGFLCFLCNRYSGDSMRRPRQPITTANHPAREPERRKDRSQISFELRPPISRQPSPSAFQHPSGVAFKPKVSRYPPQQKTKGRLTNSSGKEEIRRHEQHVQCVGADRVRHRHCGFPGVVDCTMIMLVRKLIGAGDRRVLARGVVFRNENDGSCGIGEKESANDAAERLRV